MALAKVIINNAAATLISANLTKEGERAVDQMRITIPKTTKTRKLLTILKSTALNFICVIVEINEVGIIIAKEVPTAKCIISDLSSPAESKI